ncbi:SDR family NAD(P)-dependent oxidoreductase [Aspergillus chevalieri]|uniref:Uncharacterized protein n=1 Tax=Aspergillus chevalieri TaxID=182096 RepID=A0A7R7ZR50_ASPCH|nr:uncharacterized protein ACHE_70286S [Aspergillus chevalieri]BCR91443.1 hypothetical protein ACHE_70286S [Aspergillus chevalieri]
MASKLEGTALITGAGSGIPSSFQSFKIKGITNPGIGRGTANTLIQNGINNLSLLDINISALESARNDLLSQHSTANILIQQTDVASETSIATAVKKTVEMYGRIDVAINSAGISGNPCPTHEMSLSEWQRVIDVNQTGVWICQRELIRQMLGQENLGPRRGRGVIVNLSSMFGVHAPRGEFGISPYTASKHAVIAITKLDAKTYAPHGIRINAICPGYVDTPIIADAIRLGALQAEFDRTPMRRPSSVEEVADSISFLASPMSSYMCGAALVMDGGYTI